MLYLMKEFLRGLGARSRHALTILVTLVFVIGMMPFAARYGEENGLLQLAARRAAAAGVADPVIADETEAEPPATADDASDLLAFADDPATEFADDLHDDEMTETSFMADAPAAGPGDVDTPWFPTDDDSFTYPDPVDLAEQLHIAAERLAAGEPSPEFTAHVIELFARDGKLYPTYDLDSGLPTTTEESAAVYRFALEYALQAGEHEWAAALRERLRSRDLR